MHRKRIITYTLFIGILTGCGKSNTRSYIHPSKKDPAKQKKRLTSQNDIIESSDSESFTNFNSARDWHLLDLSEDLSYGASINKSYKSLNLEQNKEVIVAVIDSGVDINHEDLKNNIWVNKNEIPHNGIDDDNNGYIDDIYGWNFIGGSDGSHIEYDTLEITRIYSRLLIKKKSVNGLSEEENLVFNSLKGEVEHNISYYTPRLKEVTIDSVKLKELLAQSKELINKTKFNSRLEILSLVDNSSMPIKKLKFDLTKLWDKYPRGGFRQLKYLKKQYEIILNGHYNLNDDIRSRVVGDNPSDFNDNSYGNNDVVGPDPSHGTHVAGTIAAERNNNLGMNGIAGNVKIMAIRAIPNGDERDKDVANAIYYAVNNGAEVINMSFGKSYSPYKDKVDEAVAYAAKKGVLIVHASGNSSKNIDISNNFPTAKRYFNGVLLQNNFENWLEIGASTKEYNLNLAARFSNYGKESVNLFAPGHKIFAPYPNDKYRSISGTSMATPVVSGVVALLLSEFPTMKPIEAKNIILKTVSYEGEFEVRKPIPQKNVIDFQIPVVFKELSSSGGIVNAYNALKYSIKLSSE